jgi:hypothetical protein
LLTGRGRLGRILQRRALAPSDIRPIRRSPPEVGALACSTASRSTAAEGGASGAAASSTSAREEDFEDFTRIGEAFRSAIG